MSILIILLSFSLLFLSFTTNFMTAVHTPLTYGEFLGSLLAHFTFLAALFFLTMFFLLRMGRKKRHGKEIPTFAPVVTQSLFVIVSSFCLSYILLICIAIVQLNSSIYLLNTNPTSLGLETDYNTIVKKLNSEDTVPEIVIGDTKPMQEVYAVTASLTGKDNYYSQVVIPSIPDWALMPLQKTNYSMFLIDNALVFNSLNPKELQEISPILGYKYISSYFYGKRIKMYPVMNLLTKDEYTLYRLQEASTSAQKIQLTLKQLDGYISSYSAVTSTASSSGSADKSARQALAVKKQQYAACIAQQPRTGDCTGLQQAVNDAQATADKIQIITDSQDADIANQLQEYQTYKDFYTTVLDHLLHSTGNISDELGVFEPPKNIHLLFDTTNPHVLADYFETVAHEYLHYASYTSADQQFTNSFFEEGLTEYFARQAIKESLHTDTNLGYPLQVKIITEMTKLIPESEFADIYFSKDEDALEKALDRVYGDGFYENNQLRFDALQYADSPLEELKIANEVMHQIGGQPLTLKDLESSYSNL